MKSPGDLQSGHVFAIDLRQRRIPHPARVVTVIGPIVARPVDCMRRLCRRPGYGYAGQGENTCRDESNEF